MLTRNLRLAGLLVLAKYSSGDVIVLVPTVGMTGSVTAGVGPGDLGYKI